MWEDGPNSSVHNPGLRLLLAEASLPLLQRELPGVGPRYLRRSLRDLFS